MGQKPSAKRVVLGNTARINETCTFRNRNHEGITLITTTCSTRGSTRSDTSNSTRTQDVKKLGENTTTKDWRTPCSHWSNCCADLWNPRNHRTWNFWPRNLECRYYSAGIWNHTRHHSHYLFTDYTCYIRCHQVPLEI